ncbi:DUF397 domain-containing protein [Stackebrandtia sp.]
MHHQSKDHDNTTSWRKSTRSESGGGQCVEITLQRKKVRISSHEHQN